MTDVDVVGVVINISFYNFGHESRLNCEQILVALMIL